MLEVTLLGCGGSMPIPNRYLSATLLQYKGRKILIDCGEGTQVSMKAINTGFKTLDLICITHLHGDHINGLPGLLATLGNSGRKDPVLIMGPVGTKALFGAFQILVPHLPFDIQILEKGFKSNELTPLNLTNEIQVSILDLDHSSPCIGYRFEVKRRPKFDVEKAITNQVPKFLWSTLQKFSEVVFEDKIYNQEMVLGESRRGILVSLITDTRPIPEIIPFINQSDLFICEGTYGSDANLKKALANKHMTFSEAATLAKAGQVKALLLTHFGVALREPEDYAEVARRIFTETKIGQDQLKIELKFAE